MSNEPLISVVLPTYNRAHSLPRAMRSVLAQSYRALELIVVDDGSSDDTEAIVRAMAAADGRVRLVRRAVNGGAAAARNTGLGEARGEWIAFQDSDDEWLLDKLQRQLDALARGAADAVLCVCGYLVHRPDSAGRGYYLGGENMTYPGDLARQALINFFFPTPSWLARRSALAAAGGFDENLRCWEDWELAIRLAAIGPFVLVDEPLYVQQVSAGSVNRQERAHAPALRRIVDKHAGRWRDDRRALAEHWFVIGRGELLYGSVPQGREALRRATSLRPHFRKAWVLLLASRLGGGFASLTVRLVRALRGSYTPPKATVIDYVLKTHEPGQSKSQRRPADS